MYLLLIEIQIQPLVHLSENTQAECISLEAAREPGKGPALDFIPSYVGHQLRNLRQAMLKPPVISVKWKYSW